MAGGVHASSPSSATVTHQMGHTILASEYSLQSQTALENCVNEANNSVDVNVGSSLSRKRKHSADVTISSLESKRMCIFNQLLTHMIIEKEKFIYISLLHKYGYSDENDFFNVANRNIFPYSVLPFPNPQLPKSIYFATESDQFKKLFPEELITGLQPVKPKSYGGKSLHSPIFTMQTIDNFLVPIFAMSSLSPYEEKQESNNSNACNNVDLNFKLVESASFSNRFRTSSISSENSQYNIDKAKQEAFVLRRVAELQKCGMWTEKRLPKIQEPPRVKAHWDYVLEELEWLAADFAEERKWKKAATRSRSRKIQKHFQEREALVQRAARAAELHKRKIASHLAKIVKSFWNSVEKLVDFKQQTKLKEKRQRALDQHLSFIVDKTEQYSSLVAESMNKTSLSVQNHSRPLSPASDGEFEPNQSSSDDEETIEAEERKNRIDPVDHSEEIEMLAKESELPIEDLLSQLPAEYFNNKDFEFDDECDSEDVGTDESTTLDDDKGDGAISDVETSQKGLKSITFLENSILPAESSSDTDEGNSNEDDSDSADIDDDEGVLGERDGLHSLLKDRIVENGDVEDENTDEKIDDVAAIAESIQPKGNTLSSTCVVTKVPFLLKHSLREYQHIGLDWLVTMYERKLNGILADEMGLGKTIQTIALLAHLASDKENWGPHLIIVPTSVMLNWEMELKKWCPAFKILTYYGNPKERRLKRTGWTKPNSFHICITSYKLVLQDHHCFRRKKWTYLILDEAQNIKNFKSQRWQRLLNFDSQRRLLLTGTPLQNNLMELWSLMHFLMPNLFSSHREFKEWFSNPVTGMIEGNSEYNENIIKRLHKVLRPFLLRRLKTEVEKQLPSKYEHIVMCRLSNRQRYLYDDFMSRAKTIETLSSGSLLSVINVLMQLRKVCNHPNLFEARPIISPFQMEGISYQTASLIDSALDYDPFRHVNLNALNLRLVDHEELSAWSLYRLQKLKAPRQLIEEIDNAPNEPPPVPLGKLNIHLKTPNNLNNIIIDNNSKNNQKIITCIKKVSSLNTNTSQIGRPNSSNVNPVKYAPIFRSLLGQGEINNMAVRRVNSWENSMLSRGSCTIQIKGGITGNSGASRICIATPTRTPIQATVLKNVIPVSIKNTQASTDCGSVNAISTSVANCNNASSVSPSISCATSSMRSETSVVAASVNSFPKVTGNSKPQIVTSSSSKPIILTPSTQLPSSSLTRNQPSNAVKTISGQRLILTKSTSGSFDTITRIDNIRPLIRIPNSSVQQGTILNNGANSTIASSLPSTIILNNSVKTNISIPKPISVSSVASTSAVSTYNTSPSIPSATTRSRSEKSKQDLVPEANKIKERRHTRYKDKLRILADTNECKSSPYVMFGCDVRNILEVLDCNPRCPPVDDPLYWRCAGHVNCINVQYAKHIHNLCYTLTNALSNSVKSIEERIQELSETFSRFIVYVPAVNARRPSMHVSHRHPSKAWSFSYMECALERHLAPRSRNLHQITSRMSTAFPDSRLIQYDCGKLQVLDTLLRRLKVEQHRVLIFTQMTRMLDVLEAFLTFHGHIYLRLDGSTRIDQRQVLMERFNADKRYFCFILSTRSGGIGVNLTGADTVIFYDSDWNPTMDAQAQDRCHRIGQTRDVHIYRLISERTVEENILKKANQKKLLGDLAIEGGNFTAAYFKSSTIHDLFDVDFNETDPAKRINDTIICSADASGSRILEKSTLNAYESALAIAEDETDVTAARIAKEEAVAELAEFDENIPLVDNDGNPDNLVAVDELSKAELEVNALIEQLTPIERWALNFMETVDAEWVEEQLAAAEAEIEQQKKEWEMERLAIERADERSKSVDDEPDEEDIFGLTYASEDAKNQTWLSIDSTDCMPIWLPLPTIISVDCEYYVDRSLKFLYETTCIPEHQLPPIYSRKEKRRLDQCTSTLISDGISHIRIRNRLRDGLSNATLSVASLEPPKSLFDRPSSVVIKLRHDMRLQKYRGLSRSAIPNVPGLKPYFPPKVNVDPEFVPEWLIHEDYALLQAIQHVQELPLNLSVMYPGHIPNWDLVSELVNQVSRIYRSPQQCKNRFEASILPREEGKLATDPMMKKHKKLKGVNTVMPHTKYTRNYKTAQLFMQDSNSTFTQMMNTRFDAIRVVSNHRTPTIKRLPLTTSIKNPKQVQLLAENEIDNDRPLTPVEIAIRRAQRIAKEKQTHIGSAQQQQSHQSAKQPTSASSPLTASPPAIQQPLQTPQSQTQISSQKTVPMSAPVSQGQTAVVVNVSQNAAISTTSPVITRTIVGQPMAVQEMIVTSKSQVQSLTTVANNTNVVTASPQKFRAIPQISTANAVTMPRLGDGKILTSAQLQLHRQQPAIQMHQAPQQFTIFHSRNKQVVLPANVVVSSPSQQHRQIQSVASSVTTSPSRNITEVEMNALLKKQQQQQQSTSQQPKITTATVIVSSSSSSGQTQFISAPVTTTAGKAVVNFPLPTTIKTTLSTSNLNTARGPTQQFRQIAIPQQIQQRKFTTQKVTPIGQVMVNVSQSGGQVISQVLTKGTPGTATQLVKIPFYTSQSGGAKQTIQVVTASALRAATGSNAAVDNSGTRQPNTIKISGSGSGVNVTTLSPQHFLNQVVALQNNQPIAVRRIQSTGNISSSTSATLAATSLSTNQIIIPTSQSQQTASSEKTTQPGNKDLINF